MNSLQIQHYMHKGIPFWYFKTFIFLTLIITGGVTMAQKTNSEQEVKSPEEISLEEELKIQKLKTDLAENKKKEAEYIRDASKAMLPSTETKGLEGTVTVNEKAGYYSEILAWEALHECAKKIAENIDVKLGQSDELIIPGQVDLAEKVALWNLVESKLDALIKVLDRSLTKYKEPLDYDLTGIRESLVGTLAAAPSILGAAADIAAFFKTDRTISFREVKTNEKALISAVAHEIQLKSIKSKKDIKLFLPYMDLSGKGELYKKLDTLMTKRSELQSIRDIFNIRLKTEIKNEEFIKKMTRLTTEKAILDKKIDNSISQGKNTDDLQKQLDQVILNIENQSSKERNLTEIINILDLEIKASDELITSLTEKTSDKPSKLEIVTDIEKIKKHQSAKLLYLFPVSQAGEIITSRTLFKNAQVSYLGGAIIGYILMEHDGLYIFSDNERQIKEAKFKRRKGIVNLVK